MDIKKIKELIAAMEKGGIKRIKIKDAKGYELELEKQSEAPSLEIVPQHTPASHFSSATAPRPPSEEITKEREEAPGSFVTSPMVGTFYSAPSPDDPQYVKLGDEVDEETVVCIIEAMKVMNEVKAGRRGRIAEILVDNAEPVEYGSKLFRII